MRTERRQIKLFIVMLFTILILAVHLSTAAEDKAAQIQELLGRYHALGQFDGTALVAEGGKVILKKGYGMADAEWDIPNAPDTKFRLGSVTKQFTATLVLQLVEDGKLKLEDKVSDVLPYYRKDTGSRITVHQLLNHTSGLPNFTARPDYRSAITPFHHSTEDLVTKFCSGDLEFEPGSKYKYSNSGYVLLGAIVERLSAKPYEQVLRERVLGPAGMRATGYDHHGEILPKRASGYQRTPEGLENAPYIDMSVPHGAGALYSTAEDLCLWDQALYGDKILSEKSKALMFTPGMSDYGYGWGIRKLPIGPGKAERTVISHGGGIEGFTSFIRRVPEDRNLVVVLSNAGDDGLAAITMGLFDILYGRTPPAPKQSIAKVVSRTIAEKGVDAGLAQFKELKATQKDAYDFSEGEINILGYQLLGHGKAEAALAIFRLNAETFPASSNVYDSLGEGLAALGKKDEAIKAYAKSLELDPTNRNAVEWLDKLTKN